jgi:cytochrome c peroxidase
MLDRHLTMVSLLLVLGLGCAPAEEQDLATDLAPTTMDLFKEASLRFEPLPSAAPNPDNPATQAKIDLGKKLYYDTRLSKDGNISCNSCHNLATFGVDHEPTSDGDDGRSGDRNSPTVLNAALHQTQFWDGRAEDVEEQAGMPILNPIEMGIPSEQFLVDRLTATEDYPPLFAAAFPEDEEPLVYANIGRALGAFERTLLTPTRFDAYLEGDENALDATEKAGLQKFIELGCTTCHNGVNVGAYSFQKFGVFGDYWEHTKSESVDAGRYAVTGKEADKYVFRVASLRNVADTGPYFHDGSIDSLDLAVRIMVKLQLGIELRNDEIESLTAFLETLSGEVPEEALMSTGG